MKSSRRNFIKRASAVSAGVVVAPTLLAGEKKMHAAKSYPICVFSKCLQFLDYPQLGEALAKIGFSAVELSVRNKGHVLPENVNTDLPKAIKTLKQLEITVPMMVTGIINPEDPLTESVLGTASEQGIGHYRMGYLRYDRKKSVMENLDSHKKIFDKLEKLNRKFGIQGCYQNHAGAGVGGPVWDLYWLLKDFDPEYIGVQYDIRHAIVEGAKSWSLGLDLLSPWIKTSAIKDFDWKKENGKAIIENVPLGAGIVDFDAYLVEAIKHEIIGPTTIHYEYDFGGAEHGRKDPSMGIAEISDYMKTDLVWLKNKFKMHDILKHF
ncbi:TIM barrel protein [uncultured Kriegella sp.]|uniref:sugar phosphate isomerase/epimerase family protein n=1 Tax=uncultured Kriegella sp. TaxID=1798910 RepID=UPI0030D809A3|tara:strand:+ start:11699 stop:12664 length:966 start_codon:yes stop_codon:yes gene_type:complete